MGSCDTVGFVSMADLFQARMNFVTSESSNHKRWRSKIGTNVISSGPPGFSKNNVEELDGIRSVI